MEDLITQRTHSLCLPSLVGSNPVLLLWDLTTLQFPSHLELQEEHRNDFTSGTLWLCGRELAKLSHNERMSWIILRWAHSKFGWSRSLQRGKIVTSWYTHLHKCFWFPKSLCEGRKSMHSKDPWCYQSPCSPSPVLELNKCHKKSYYAPVSRCLRRTGKRQCCLQSQAGKTLASPGTSYCANWASKALEEVWACCEKR